MKLKKPKRANRPFDERLLKFITDSSKGKNGESFIGTILRVTAIVSLSSGYPKRELVRVFSSYIDTFESNKK
jgi:hypothetical protein